MQIYQEKGFAIIALLLAVAIILILTVIYFRPRDAANNAATAQKQAEKSLQQSNQTLQNYQNQLNQEQ